MALASCSRECMLETSIPIMNRSTRQLAVLWTLTAVVGSSLARGQNPEISVQGYHILGPSKPADFPKWIADMKRWRMEFLQAHRL